MLLAGGKYVTRCSPPKELYSFKQLRGGQCGKKMGVGAEDDPEGVGRIIPALVRPGLSLQSKAEVTLRSNLGVRLKLGLVLRLWTGFGL